MDHLSQLTGRPARPSKSGPREAGYTMAELLVAVSISVIAATMSLEALAYMSKSMGVVDRGSTATDEASLLNEYLATLLMSTGGGTIRPWAAIWVEDNFNGDGTDRLTFAELVDIDLQCSIQSVDGDLVHVDASEGCCLTDEFVNRQVIMMTGSNDSHAHWESRIVTDVDLDRCLAFTDEGQAKVVNVSPPSDDLWADGPIAVVHVRVVWVDTSLDQLKVAEDYDLDGNVETRILADRVVDFQAALGYDVPPWDWQITDTGDRNDEWLFNSVSDEFGKYGLEGARRTDLRLLKFGLTVGSPVKASSDIGFAQLLDGPLRTRQGWVFRSALGTTSMRNHDIMR